jgi:hypothetical protein
MVPDHWAPIAFVARAQGWSRSKTAGAAALAGTGHVVSTLVLGAIVWSIGTAAAVRYGHLVDRIAAFALIAFGIWMAVASWRELRSGHEHAHAASGRTALLLILGSSPMIEGLPAFFAASTYGPALLGVMALVFAASTIVTYVVLSTLAHGGLERVALGRFERYGEVLSGAFVACVGIIAALT